MSSLVTPSHPQDSPIDHRSLLNVFNWIVLVVSAIIVLTRLVTRTTITRSIGFDDVFIFLSMIFAVGQTIAVSNAVGQDLGLVVGNVSPDRLVVQEKSIYAAMILFVLSQGCSKSSVVFFVRVLTPVLSHRRAAAVIFTAIALWTIVSIFGFALLCGIPSPWNYSGANCVNLEAFYTFVEISSAIIDATLIMLPFIIISNLQLALKTKFTIIAFFSSRALVMTSSIAQLILLYKNEAGSRSFLNWSFVLMMQIIQGLGIVAACGPYLKALMESLNTGMLGNNDVQRRARGASKYSNSNKQQSSKFRRMRPSQSTRAINHSSGLSENQDELIDMEGIPDYSATSYATVAPSENLKQQPVEDKGDNFILHTTSFQVSSR